MADSFFSDAELWKSIQADDCSAFTILFKRYWAVLYRTALHYTEDRQLAEEVVHDLFVALWKGRGHLVIDSFESYLKAGARYEILRQLKKRRSSAVRYTDALPEGAATNEGERQIRDRELENGLREKLRQLPDRCREVFLLSRKEHLSNAEIAVQLGISKRSVENQITFALKFLRSNLKNITVLLLCYNITLLLL
ncbi:MAG TPA: RNA polymerase sigma-70 factor [Puia sp.]|nr:RNA polymerase sigma-70 factor [Puia sp.]